MFSILDRSGPSRRELLRVGGLSALGLSLPTLLASEAHAFIRSEAGKAIGTDAAKKLRIIYGGSVKPENAHALMSQEEIDGALVGGASLDPKSFAAIVKW